MRRFVVLLIISMMGLTVVQAQEEVTLVPFESPLGFNGVIPEGWAEVGSGSFVRRASAADLTTLLVQAAPMSAAELGELLVGQLGLGTLPEPSEGIETEALSWTVYDAENIESPAGTLSVAIAVADGEQGYVVVLLTAPDEFVVLRESVFVPVVEAVTPVTASVEGVEPADSDMADTYQDPENLYSVPVPTNWSATEEDGYALLSDPEGLLNIYILTVESDDPVQVIDDSVRQIFPEFDLVLEDASTQEPPPAPGVERNVIVTYDGGEEATVLYQGFAQVVDGRTYLVLFTGEIASAVRRQSQINVIATGFTINAIEQVDLSGIAPAQVDEAIITELENFINEALPVSEVPGLAIAIVQDGEVVYEQGFGLLEMGGQEPVTPDTLFMIGSTTKTFTTLYLAQLVDAGVITWDTPVVEVFPDFSLADPEITQEITVENLVCACSGVPRRDLELVFNANELTAEDVIASLADYQLFTDFGEAFQYSNQLVAMGGYAGAFANGASVDNVYEQYVSDIETLTLTPLGMGSTTFDFAEVENRENVATPHGFNLDFEFYPLGLETESFVTPIAPRIVSEAALRETWEPQISVSAEMSYGLGWFVDEYKGQPLLQHGGNTFGFTSDFAFLTEANLGIVVLTNARSSNILNEAIRTRLFELVFDQEADSVIGFEFAMEQGEQSIAETTYTADFDVTVLEDYVGTFTNPQLGTLTISIEDGVVTVDAGEFVTELRASLNDDGDIEDYVLYGAPIPGVPLEFSMGEGDIPQIAIDIVTDQYVFT
ncbi:MAG: beta-lactamase family protein, partial [Anaerolineae bacterium]|nr:beta-lactamase family protein [Anaerolineae bacterium]